MVHVYAQKHNVSACYIELRNNPLSATISNISLSLIVEELENDTDPAAQHTITMIETENCLQHYEGWCKAIIIYQNITCSFLCSEREAFSPSSEKLLREADRILLLEGKLFAIKDGKEQEVTL